MSLDLYIRSKTPVRKRGTGVYIRENGKTRELKTVAEVKEYFPDADLSDIKMQEFETNDLWHENITHNMGKMASHVPVGEQTLYMYLWRPEEIGFTHVTAEYVQGVFTGLLYLKAHKDEILQYLPPIHPETGKRWGSYEQLVDFCVSLVNCLNELDYETEEYEIYASR